MSISAKRLNMKRDEKAERTKDLSENKIEEFCGATDIFWPRGNAKNSLPLFVAFFSHLSIRWEREKIKIKLELNSIHPKVDES